MESTNKGLESLDRPLTKSERDLVHWLLEHGLPESDQFLSQIDSLTVIRKCTCGCPTVYFAVNGDSVSRKSEVLISDYRAEVDGEPVGVTLFQAGGKISSLEVYSMKGTDKPFGLPPIESIQPY